MCEHKFKWDRQSVVIYNGKLIEIDVWKCVYCEQLQIIDRENSKVISLDGMLGVEV